jgi:NAD+ kinase
MSPPFRCAAIFAKTRAGDRQGELRAALEAILAVVHGAGVEALVDARSCAGLPAAEGACSMDEIAARAQVAIVLGGDGTMLSIARELAAHDIPLIGINFGRLGFMTDIALAQMPEVLAPMLAGQFETDRRSLLEGEVRRGGQVLHKAHALNDIVVAHGITGGLVEFTVRVDGENMYTQRADGFILATPTGSTAYALSANGPILHPSLAGMVLVPVAPHTLSNRPIALPDSARIEIELNEVRMASAYFDMQSYADLQAGDVVQVGRSQRVATLLHPAGYSYFATLRQKLHWNIMASPAPVRS